MFKSTVLKVLEGIVFIVALTLPAFLAPLEHQPQPTVRPVVQTAINN